MKLLARIAALILIPAGLVVTTTVAASAHTPAHSETCAGVMVKGTSYESRDTNTLSVTLDGVTVTRTFSTSDTLTVPIPQDGRPHTWSSYVHTTNHNSGYSRDYGPGTLTCGQPQPDPIVTHATSEQLRCITNQVIVHHTMTTTAYTFDGQVWVLGAPVTVTDPDTTRPMTPAEKRTCPSRVHHTTPHLTIVDRCRCKHDSVKVHGRHLAFTSVRQHGNTWTIRVVADQGWTVPTVLGGHTYAQRATYTVHTTNKPCPCQRTHTCHHAHHQPPKHHHHHCGCRRDRA